jgi:UDP-glucose 4-epimerase
VFSTYGPLDNDHWLLPLIADALLSHDDIDLTSGEQPWSYLYGADAGEALATLVLAPNATGIVNVGNPTAPRLRDTIDAFVSHFAVESALNFGARSPGPNPILRLEPDVSKLESFGWRARESMATGLAQSARWFSGQVVEDPTAQGRFLPTRP